MRYARSLLAALALAAAALSAPLTAQVDVPSLKWRSIETAHFRIHYEPELEAWAQDVARHMESVRTAVATRVGYSYPHKIDLLVEDPLNQPNGSAWPSLTTPAMRFWATPPSPTSVIGNSRGWGEMLAVHEYAHLAHLLRPSRKPLSLPLGIASIVPLSPMVRVPAWVSEGYATVIEGELTGSGRPNGALRPAILRTLALEGYLPAYGELDATGRFNGGAMRYLVGSAYLEWLQAARGDSALPQLWRRVTARRSRNFPTAFTQTFGDAPSVLYGRFTAEVTAKAVAAQEHLRRSGLAQGTLVQKWTWAVGSPDVSPDGTRIAVRRATNTDPGGILILNLAPDTARARRDSVAQAKRLRKDPEDVADYRAYPAPLKRSAVLRPVNGVSYDAPRWLPDGERLLVTRPVPLADGRVRNDLFEWRVKGNRVRRITKGAGILLADPTPDGRQAAALQCGGGACSLLVVDLATGTTRVLAPGTLDGSYAGVRVSPDGRYVATARQRGARWVPQVIELATGAARSIGPDDSASRFSPAWENDSTLLVMSDASGAIEIERVPLADGPITTAVRTLGAANAPEVGPDGRIWWLDLHGRGWDLRVNDARSALPLGAPLDTMNFPAVKRVDARLAQRFDTNAVSAPRRYGAGPFGIGFLLLGSDGQDGAVSALGASFGDPVGRSTGLLYAGGGANGAWNGARAAYTWRGFRPTLTIEGFTTDYQPSRHAGKAGRGWENFDRRYTGALAALDYSRGGVRSRITTRLGGSIGRSENPTLGSAAMDRTLYFAELGGGYTFDTRPRQSLTLDWKAGYAAGTAEDADFARTTVDARVALRVPPGGVALRARGGEVNADAPTGELFYVGGTASPFVDPIALGNRIEQLGLPFGILGGRRYGILTAETVGPVRVFHDWMVGGDDELGETLRVVGAEVAFDVARLSVLRIPNANFRIGVNHSLNGPARNVTQVYSSFSVRP